MKALENPTVDQLKAFFKLPRALDMLKEIADMIQYETSFESPAYKRCWEFINELEEL